ncbi:MAG: DNA-3-methyladenine glycosylase 2 family protein, partial [Acidimicrobiia bacterium]
METASFPIEVPLELRLTLQPLGKTSAGTTLIRADGWWRAMRTPQGPATLHLRRPTPGRLEARGWGSGAEWALRSVPGLVGLLDRPEALVTDHPVVGPLQRRFPGLRLPRTGLVFEVLLPTIVAQK